LAVLSLSIQGQNLLLKALCLWFGLQRSCSCLQVLHCCLGLLHWCWGLHHLAGPACSLFELRPGELLPLNLWQLQPVNTVYETDHHACATGQSFWSVKIIINTRKQGNSLHNGGRGGERQGRGGGVAGKFTQIVGNFS